jgi:hypothetical protein
MERDDEVPRGWTCARCLLAWENATGRRAGKSDRVLYLRPVGPPESPFWDEVCERMTLYLAEARSTGTRYRGFHSCTGEGCDATSSNTDYVLPGEAGVRTNSLALHYLTLHRSEISAPELKAVREEVGLGDAGAG